MRATQAGSVEAAKGCACAERTDRRRHGGRAPDAVLEARLLLAVVDGLMFDAVSAPGTLTPAELETALDAYLDRLLPADDHDRRFR